MASEPIFARAVNAPRGSSNPRPPDGVHGAVGFGRQRSGAALGREAAAGSTRPERCRDGASSATSSAGLAAKGGGGVQSGGSKKKSNRRQQSGRVVYLGRDGIRRRATRGHRGFSARKWWRTNFGNWIKFTPPQPKCVASDGTHGVTVKTVAQQADRDLNISSEFSAAGAADGGCRPCGVAKAAHDRCNSVDGVIGGTMASGFGVGSKVWAGVQAVVHALRGSAAGLDQSLVADEDIGARGAAQAPAGSTSVVRDEGGMEASTEAWAEEKTRLLLRVEELKREVAGLNIELESKRARTRRENAQMKEALTKEHQEQVARLRSDARAAWDAGTAQAAELAQEQHINSELNHEIKLAHSEIVDLKQLLRSAVERAATNPESLLSSKVEAVMDEGSDAKSELENQQQEMMAMLRGMRQQFKRW